MNFISLNYALENYDLKKALLWGNSIEHFKKAVTSTERTKRFIHIAIGVAEFFPLIGQIASLFEYAIVQYKHHLTRQQLLHEAKMDQLTTVMNKLPVDCYMDIFPLLDVKSAFNLSRTNKKFSHLVDFTFRRLLKINFPHSNLKRLSPLVSYNTHMNQRLGQIAKKIELKHPYGVSSLAFLKSNLLVTCSKDLHFWKKGREIAKVDFREHDPINKVYFSQRGSKLLFSSFNVSFVCTEWFLYDRKGVKILKDCGKAHFQTLSSDGTLLASYKGKKAQIRNANSLDVIKIFSSAGEISAMTFSPDNKTLAIAFKGGLCAVKEGLKEEIASGLAVCVWDLENHTSRLILKGHAKLITDLDFSPDGKTLATISNDGTLRLWDLENSEIKKEEKILDKSQIYRSQVYYLDRLVKVKFSPDGNFISVTKRNHKTSLFSRNAKNSLIVDGNVKFSPHHDYFINYSLKTVDLWQLYDRKFIKTLFQCEDTANINAVSFSNDGMQIAIAFTNLYALYPHRVVLLDFKP
jgi:WD40 repeat protein